jgi:hypothetical protein
MARSPRKRGPVDTGLRNAPYQSGTQTSDTLPTEAGVDEPDPKDPTEVAQWTKELSPDEFASRLKKTITEAENFVDMIVAPQRVRAAEYYMGQPFGDEEEGRSDIVLTELRDVVLATLPSLLRVFCSGDKVGEYEPRSAAGVEMAEQATDTANYVFIEKNAGFIKLHSVFKDALIKKMGVLTWWAEEKLKIVHRVFSGMSEEDVRMFEFQNPDAEFDNVELDTTGNADQMTGPLFRCTVRLKDKNTFYKVACVPPESFIIDRRATCVEDAAVVGTREMRTVSDLVEMGFREEEIREHGSPGRDDGWYWLQERQVRNPGYQWPDYPVDPSMERVKFYDVYVRIDADGDGVAELHRVRAIGEGFYVLKDELVDSAPYALFCPDPEPHTVYGQSLADQTMDIQRIKSHIMRNVMDSLAQSIHPRTVAVEGQVNMDDVLNMETGAIIRARAPGMVQELSTTFVGQQALPVMDYMDVIKTQRTGVKQGAAGLDPETLQSTTASAVNMTQADAQQRLEMIARIFAETGMRELYKGLLRLICEHQDKPMVVRLRGKYITVDPTTWDADMDVSINVGLGRGDDTKQMAFLSSVLAQQTTIMQEMGLINPVVTLKHFRNTLTDIANLAGRKDDTRYFAEITPELEQQVKEQLAASQKPDPNLVIAKAELAKVNAEAFAKAQQAAINRAKLQLDADMARDKLDADIILKAIDLQGKYGQPVDTAMILQLVNSPRRDVQALADVLIEREKQAAGQVLGMISADAVQESNPQSAPQAQDAQQPPQPPQQGPDLAQRAIDGAKPGVLN